MFNAAFKAYVVTTCVILFADPKDPKNSGISSMTFTEKDLAQLYMDNSINQLNKTLNLELKKDEDGNIFFVDEHVYIKVEMKPVDMMITRETIEK